MATISPIEALRVIEVLAENEGFERMKFLGAGDDGKERVESDKTLDAIYRIAHAARSSIDCPGCGGGHSDWHAEACEIHDGMVTAGDIPA